ncbi:MAG: AAA family ATPase [Cyanobacteria bacterium J06639_1]
MDASTLPAFIQAMLTPEFYPHPVAEPIQLLQTHISYVLLTGEFAYKAKKPLNFGFLDYSTLEKRKFYCHEELRLNQRGAPDLYLEVVPIYQNGDRFQLDVAGEPVEYAVKMKQFPQDTLLSELYERGDVTEDLVVQLAKAIAAYHDRAETNDYIRSFGTIEAIRQSIDENYDQTEAYIGGPQTQAQFDDTRAYTDRFFAEEADLFARRVKGNRVRECHGDIHLRNICYWKNKLHLFDCIEFNEPFRFVDVMFDIAYIVMDFLARDRPDLSALFLNTYTEQTGDWEGLEILPLYVSRQSYVRAKVTSFMLGDPGVPAAAKAAASETAAQYYRLAWDCTRSRRGQIVLTSGLSGSGKSTVAGMLSREMGAIHIRSDAVRKHLAGISLDRRGDEAGATFSGIYTPEMTQKTYDHLIELGTTLARRGETVILDATFDRLVHRQNAIARAREAGLPLHVLSCEADINVLKARLQERKGDIADATVTYLVDQERLFEPLTDAEREWAIAIDTSLDLKALQERVRAIAAQLSAR